MHKVVISCAIDNPRSRAVAERLGFIQEGILRQVVRLGVRYVSFNSAMACEPGSKAVFRKGFAAMDYAVCAIADRQRRSCRPKPSRRPSTWFAFVRCCTGHRLDSRPGPSVLCQLLHACDRSWRHDVRTKFPSRVIHTPVVAGSIRSLTTTLEYALPVDTGTLPTRTFPDLGTRSPDR